MEATTIVPTISEGKNLGLEPSISAALGDFTDRIEEAARLEGSLVGAYAVAIGPMPYDRSVRNRVAERILGFIRETKDQSVTPPTILDRVGQYVVEIKKFHMGRNYLVEMIDLPTRSEREIIDDFRGQLANQVERKSAQYVDFEDPLILLLLDGFHVVDPSEWLDATSSLPRIATFDAVFRIKPANDPLLLSSQSPFWRSLEYGIQGTDA